VVKVRVRIRVRVSVRNAVGVTSILDQGQFSSFICCYQGRTQIFVRAGHRFIN